MSVLTFIQCHSTFSGAVAKVSGLHMSSTMSRLVSVSARLSVEVLESPVLSNCLIIYRDPTIFCKDRMRIMGREKVVQFWDCFHHSNGQISVLLNSSHGLGACSP
jgi:hypothetical protein